MTTVNHELFWEDLEQSADFGGLYGIFGELDLSRIVYEVAHHRQVDLSGNRLCIECKGRCQCNEAAGLKADGKTRVVHNKIDMDHQRNHGKLPPGTCKWQRLNNERSDSLQIDGMRSLQRKSL